MNVAIIVPARIGSTRFPKKLLHRIKGKPVIVWTADRIKREAPEFPLFFAVDHESLAEVLRKDGYEAIMTDPGHSCGTDRIAEANRRLQAKYVINVQADEPLVTGGQIRQLVDLIQQWKGSTKTVVTATQQLDIVEDIADRVLILQEGKILADGAPSEILSNTDLLLKTNLIHAHRHSHGGVVHAHPHLHRHSHDEHGH